MQRRDFLKALGTTGFCGALGGLSSSTLASNNSLHTGKILLTMHASGGWDHSSFSDPRENPQINHWADNLEAGTAGSLRFAPFAENAEFFNKYHASMLVINGIDLQTNGHDAARRHRSTGNIMGGFPTLNELYAASVAPNVPMPYVHSGGFSDTAGILPFTDLPDENLLRTLTNPNLYRDERTYFTDSHLDILQRHRQERLDAQLAREDNLPRWQQKLSELKLAREGTGTTATLASVLPDDLDNLDLKGNNRNGIGSLHLFLILASSGLTATGSFSTGGWDSHGNHDNRHTDTLTHMVRLLDYLWTKAESMQIADRLIVHVTSDVGRTPHYNSNNGKDHWSVGSDILMMKNAPWADRIVGLSGPGHQKTKLNPNTLQADESGIYLRPKHIHAQLRKLLGIDGNIFAQRFNLEAENFALFDPSVSSGIQVKQPEV